jgi:hypothetical protein
MVLQHRGELGFAQPGGRRGDGVEGVVGGREHRVVSRPPEQRGDRGIGGGDGAREGRETCVACCIEQGRRHEHAVDDVHDAVVRHDIGGRHQGAVHRDTGRGVEEQGVARERVGPRRHGRGVDRCAGDHVVLEDGTEVFGGQGREVHAEVLEGVVGGREHRERAVAAQGLLEAGIDDGPGEDRELRVAERDVDDVVAHRRRGVGVGVGVRGDVGVVAPLAGDEEQGGDEGGAGHGCLQAGGRFTRSPSRGRGSGSTVVGHKRYAASIQMGHDTSACVFELRTFLDDNEVRFVRACVDP